MKKIEERDKRKMDEMKKKLHTDDEGISSKHFIEICKYFPLFILTMEPQTKGIFNVKIEWKN